VKLKEKIPGKPEDVKVTYRGFGGQTGKSKLSLLISCKQRSSKFYAFILKYATVILT
jgi:hypothetical protein